MKQQDLEGLEAAGLKPIVIDEDFDFNSLNGLLTRGYIHQPTITELCKCIAYLCDLFSGTPDDDVADTAIADARKLIGL